MHNDTIVYRNMQKVLNEANDILRFVDTQDKTKKTMAEMKINAVITAIEMQIKKLVKR